MAKRPEWESECFAAEDNFQSRRLRHPVEDPSLHAFAPASDAAFVLDDTAFPRRHSMTLTAGSHDVARESQLVSGMMRQTSMKGFG